jgi:integrase
MNITKSAVDRLTTGFLWDDTLKGFGVRCRGKGKVYVLKYQIGKRQRWVTIGRHGSPWTPDQARAEAKRLLGLVAGGTDPAVTRDHDKASSTVKEMAVLYLVYIKARRKPTTHKCYKCLVDTFVIPALGTHRGADVNSADIARLHDGMSGTPAQANLTVKIMSAMFQWAAKRGLVPKDFNPVRGAVEKYTERPRERYLTVEEFKRLGMALDEAKAEFPYAVFAIGLIALTGARRNEILTLKWVYVDTDQGVLRLPDSKTGPKTIYLNAAAVALLSTVPRVASNEHVIIGGRPGDYLKSLGKPWKAICRAARLEGVRVHDLRHSFASLAAGSGMSLHIIGKLLGHVNAKTTQRYAHLAHAPMIAASDTVGVEIAGLLAPENISEKAA